MPRTLTPLPVLSLLVFAIGCGVSDQPELGEVRGTVYLDEKPLDGAIVYFSPEGGGRVSQAMTDAQGIYELVYIGQTTGAKVGDHQVRITTAYETTDPKTGTPVVKKELVPKRYNDEKTELTAKVEPGDNSIDFRLKSK